MRNTTIRLDDYHDVMARSEFSCAATSHPMHQDVSRTPFRLRLTAPVAALTSEERTGFAHLLERLTTHHAVVVVGHNLRVKLESAASGCAAAIDFDDSFIYDEIKKDSENRSIKMIHLSECEQDYQSAFREWSEKTDKVSY